MLQRSPVVGHDLTELKRAEHRLFAFLGVAVALSIAFHWWIGPEELQRNHMLLGRGLLFGEPVDTPAHPMWGYAIVIALLGPWTVLFNGAAGFAVYVWAYREMNLGRAMPSAMTYLATLAYAAIAGSWHDTSLWLSVVLASTALLYKYDVTAAVPGAVVGVLWGLAYNIRSEALLMFAAFLVTSLAYYRLAHLRTPLRHHAAVLAAFVVMMVPWGLYTEATLGKYSPSSTNGGAVAYYSLGLVPDNGHGIHFKDEYVFEQAKLIGEASPWSSRSNDHFRAEYVRLITAEPSLFAKKIAWGIFTALRSGVYFPDFRALIASTPQDDAHLQYIYLDFKAYLGVPESYLRADRDLLRYNQPRTARPTSLADILAIGGTVVTGNAMKLAFLVALIQFLFLLGRSSAAKTWGPLAPLSVSMLLSTVAISALLIPSTRLNSVVFVFAALLLQMARSAAAASTRDLAETAPH